MRLSFSSLFSRVALLTAILSFSLKGTAWADSTYTLGWGAATGATGTYTNFTATSGSVTGVVSFSSAKNKSSNAPAYNSNNSDMRLYYHSGGDGGSITLTPASGITITGFVMTTSTAPSVKYSVDGGSATSVTASNNTYTVSGISATSSITIQNVNTSNTQLRIKTIQISYTGGGTPTCETPTFSIEEGTYYGTQSVELACATDGATIHYTTNGTTPTSSSTTYSSAISVSSTTTIKAIAVKSEYEDSEVASAIFTIKDPIEGYNIDFEEVPAAYVDWTMNNIGIHSSGMTAHGGSYWGSNVNESDNGTSTAYIQTKEKVAYPNVFTCYVSKESTNTTSSNWKIQVSSDGADWEDVSTQSATSMSSGNWVEFTGNIKATKQTDVYVRLYYDGSTAKRAVDDISLTTYVPVAVEEPVITVPSTFTLSTTASISCETDGATIYYSFDNSSWLEYTSELTITSTTTIYAKAIKGQDESTVAQFTTTKELATANVTISDDSFDIGETATVSTNGPSVTLTSSNPSIASVDGVTVTGVAAGSVTITATWSANEDYAAGSKNFSVTITDPNAPGTENNPFTVAQAISNTPGNGTSANVYIHGYVSRLHTASIIDDGNNHRYYISDDGTTNNELLVYKGKGLNNVSFSAADDLLVGDEVKIYGGLTMYSSTPEVASGNYLVYHRRPSDTEPIITISSYSIEATKAETEGTLTVTYKNVETSAGVEIQWFESDGSTPSSQPSWIDVEVNNEFNVDYLIASNTGGARNAYFKVYGIDGEANDVYSNLVSVSQAGAPLSYATLPFSFNGGKNDIADKEGLSHTGLGSDYSKVDNTKLKFDGTGDNLILKINENPGVLSFSIKGNDFSGGTFTVQISSDGVSYSDAATYTELGEEEITINDLASNVRYIKWIYTTKSSGNVGLGNINLTKPAVNPETIDITASLNNGFYWATFYNGESRYNLPEGAQAFTLNASKQLYILGTDGSVIPAGTAVIIKADSAAITLTKSDDDASSISVNGGSNILVGADAPTPTYSVVGTPYVLGISGGALGYYKYTGSGIPAGKAYYIVNE